MNNLIQIEEPSRTVDPLEDQGIALGLELAAGGLRLAIAVGGNVEIVPGPVGGDFLPGVVGYDGDGDLVAGAPGLADATRVDPVLLAIPDQLDPRGKSATERLAALIAAARHALSLKAKRPVTRAVASVPLGHGPAARAAMLQAVEAAGLDLLRLVEAPVAAALALELESRGDGDYLWLARGVAGFEAGVVAVDGNAVRLADYDLADRLDGLAGFVARHAAVAGLLLDRVTAAEAATLTAAPVLPGFAADRSIVIGAALMAEALAD
ncbi:MAG TPA: Hsp70 family protein [Aliidongia sp.]|nr:Hsp70 family protein [Aliidongia sp.]